MRTKKAIHDILGRIMETGGMSSAMEADLGYLRDEFDERDRLLGIVAEPWDEEADEVEVSFKQSTAENELSELQARYDDLVARYKQNFFAGGVTHAEDHGTDEAEGVVIAETQVGAPGDPTDVTIDDLFKEVE